MRAPSHAGRHPPEGRTHPRTRVFSHNGVPDGKLLYRQVAALKNSLATHAAPFSVAAPLLHAQLAWLMHPQELSERVAALTTDLWQLQWRSVQRAFGLPSHDPVQPHADDPRFTDPVWTESPTWGLVKYWYLAFTHHMQDMLFETPGLSGKAPRFRHVPRSTNAIPALETHRALTCLSLEAPLRPETDSDRLHQS